MNTDQVINDFLDTSAKQEELEKDINIFSAELAPRLLLELDREGCLASFYDTNFSLKFITHKAVSSALMFDVRLLDLDNYKKCLRFNIPEKARIKRATFEHEGQYKLEDELRNVLVMLFFDYYDIPIGPQEEDDGTVVVHH